MLQPDGPAPPLLEKRFWRVHFTGDDDRGTFRSMSRLTGLPPVAHPGATRLILGSMPGDASLRAGQYYAHPRNLFWPLMERCLQIPASLPYPDRCAALTAAGLALWDVLHSCTRRGSLDAAIESATLVPNLFAEFFVHHPDIRLLCFNGAVAEKLYLRHVLPTLSAAQAALPRVRLPSTSPANASISHLIKQHSWESALTSVPAALT